MKRVIAIALVCALTLAAFVLLVFNVPTVQKIPYWFWTFRHTPLQPWVLALALGLPPLLYLCRRGPGKHLVLDVLPFALFGLALQYGVAFSEGRGVPSMRDRFLKTGHAQFAHIAVFEKDIHDVLTHYERFTAQPNEIFARSKPPGTVIFYVLVDRVGRELPYSLLQRAPEENVPVELLRTANFALLVFPLLAVCILFPLGALARDLLPPELSRWPLLLYVLCPPFALIPMHLDQTLFPLLQTTMMLVILRAARATDDRRAVALAGAAGALVWLSLFVTFSLLPGVLLAVLLGAYESRRWPRIVRGAAIAFAVAVMLSLIAYAEIRYDPVVRFRTAMTHHQHFKAWKPTAGALAESAVLDGVELAYVFGLPLMALAAVPMIAAARRRTCSFNRFVLVSAIILVLLPILSMTQAEVARLWMFMLPSIAISAAAGVRATFPKHAMHALSVTAAIELFWTLALKHWADFY